MQDDDHKAAFVELKDDAKITDAQAISISSTFEFSYVSVAGIGKSVDGAADSAGDLAWERT